MRTLRDAVASSIKDRARAFRRQVDREQAEIGGSGLGLSYVLELFTFYIEALEKQVNDAWKNPVSNDIGLAELRLLMQHLQVRVGLFDDRFSRGHRRVPRSLAAAIEKECSKFGLMSRDPVLTIGPPGNFVTFVADLEAFLFRDLVAPDLPPHLSNFNPVMIAVPDLEGTRASWQPIVVGHELAHYLQRAKPVVGQIPLVKAFEATIPKDLGTHLPPWLADAATPRRALLQVAARWLNELVCDAYAVHCFGVAGATAIIEFLESVGATNLSGRSHPPGSLRAKLMLEWLGPDLTEAERQIVQPYESLAQGSVLPNWAMWLFKLFTSLSHEIITIVDSWAPLSSYLSRNRSDVVMLVAEQMRNGKPGVERVRIDGDSVDVEPPDVVNACWLADAAGTKKPINRLAAKALDTLDFLDKWVGAGGEVSSSHGGDSDSEGFGVLGEADIRHRLLASDDTALFVSPRLPGAVHGASIDIRLGSQFIIFQQSATPSFDALDIAQDPRSMQLLVEKAWGDTFYLHPNQLVLAATLEYFVLPNDLTAQVVTRSSYGRLGLISATAIQVHPGFAGCLTLELVNLGEMPLTITPGERIAQLVFMKTSEPLPTKGRYSYPTGPEFSRIHADEDALVLRKMREGFRKRRRIAPPAAETD